MPNRDQIRPLIGFPDHGFGQLGRLAHCVLAEYVDVAVSVPHLHLGQNTLPDPPFPLAAQVPFGDLSDGWTRCGRDLAGFLRAGAQALRSQSVPDASTYSERVRTLQRVLRFDSIALVWRDQQRAEAATLALVADRAGGTLAARLPDGDGAAGIGVSASQPAPDDPVIVLLRDVLLAQYEWTSAVFGVVP